MTPFVLWTLRAAATILLGLLLSLALRRRSAAVRSVALRATLVAVWALPLVALVAPRVEVALPEEMALPATVSAPLIPREERDRFEESLTPSKPVVPTPVSSQNETASRPYPSSGSPRPAFDPFPWIARVYVAVALALALRSLVALARLRRIARAASPLEPGIDLTSALSVPVTFGLLRPRILLPEFSKDWPDARVRAAALHERAHVRRHDWAWQTLASLFSILHWANPLGWLLARALRDAAEAAADDEVLAQMSPSEYARELLAVAASARPVGPALAMARRGGVRDRVVAILAAGRDRRRPTLAAGGLLLLVLFAASLAVAGVRRAAAKVAEDSALDPRIVARAKEGGHGPVRLADGRTVELLDLGRFQEGAIVRWRPDGALKERIDDPGRISETVMGPSDQNPDQFLLRFRVRGAAPGDLAYDLKPDYGFRWSWNRFDDRGPADRIVVASLNPPKVGAAKAAVYVGFASGPWRTYCRSIPYGTSPTPAGPGQISITFDRPHELDIDPIRIVAYDRQGRPLDFQGTGSMAQNGRTVTFATGPKADAARIVRVDLQFRPNEWVRFSDLPVAARPASGAVRLTEIVGRDAVGNLASWDGAGRTLPPTPEGNPFAGFEETSDERLVRLEFGIDGPKGGQPSVRFDVPPPVKLGAWGPVPLGQNRAMAVLRVPKGQRAADVRMGLADGPWLRYDLPFVRRPYGGRLRDDMHGIEVVLPNPLRDEAVELRAYAGTRRLDPYTVMTGSDGTTATLVLKGDSKRVTRFEVWRRPYRWREFKATPLVPPASSPYGPFAVTGGASVELIGVWTPGRDLRAWRPDGTPTNLKPLVPYADLAPDGYRHVLLAFRLRGTRLADDPWVRTIEAKGVRGMRLNQAGWRDGSREDSGRVIWQMVAVPAARRLAEVGMQVEATPWESGATMARGTDMGQASWREDGSHVVAGVRYTALTVRPHLMLGAAQAFRLSPVDAKGRVVESFGTTTNEDGTFTFSVAQPARVVGWRWETRPREVVRFRDVRLEPAS